MISDSQVDAAISMDEIGIETAIYGDLRLRSAFSLIFEREGGNALAAVAAESMLVATRGALLVDMDAFHAALQPAERRLVDRIATTLHIRNHGQLGIDEHVRLDHMLTLGPSWRHSEPGWPAMMRRLSDLLGATEFAPERLICSVPDPERFGRDGLRRLVPMIERMGHRLCLGGAGEGGRYPEVSGSAPRVVRIDGAWFRNMAESATALRLFTEFGEAVRQNGGYLLVDHIGTPDQFVAALDAGADLFQGDFLSRPALAGTAIETTIAMPAWPEGSNVVSLFGSHDRS